jgi:hypothetical protein
MDDEQNNDVLPTEDDLIKAMDVLEQTARSTEGGDSVRHQDLMMRMAAGEDLSKSERDELARFVAGDVDNDLEDLIEKSSREAMSDDPAIVEGWEISPYLDARDTALCKSLDEIKQAFVGSAQEQSAVTARLAKGMHAVGMSLVATRRELAETQDLLKSLTGVARRQPQHTGKGRTSRVGQSFNDNGPKGEGLAKSEGAQLPQNPADQKAWLNAQLTTLIKSTEPNGPNAGNGFGIMRGIDLVHEQAKLENANQVSPACMALLQEHAGIN